MKKLILTLTVAAAVLSAAGKTKTIAHRGFWKTPGSAQNSITALLKADSVGCYGSEFDVWMSKDGKLVVNHDPTFQGKSMEQSTFEELTSLQLSNGENLPSLEEYLTAAKNCRIRLVLELKPHKKAERENQAVKQIVEMVERFGLEDRTDYISFSLNACKQFIAQAPKGTQVYYLNGGLSPEELKQAGFAGLDYHLGVVKNRHPEWIETAHSLGLKVNCWTINNAADMLWLIENKVDFITTNEPETLIKLLRETYGEK